MLNLLASKKPLSLKQQSLGNLLPKLKGRARLFVDADLADYVRRNTKTEGKHERLNVFCRELGLGFKSHQDFGYMDDPRTGIKGYYVFCESH